MPLIDKPARHNVFQREYFETVERARIALADTPYVRAHLARMIAAAEMEKGHSVLEVGCGLGKFTLPLVNQGYSITANDLSPRLLERLDAECGGRVRTICGDVTRIGETVSEQFDRIIGFFVLHHLIDLPAIFSSLASATKPGGRIAFCEPVGLNPLYYAQILLTPGMRFAGEPSLAAMRTGVILPALIDAGFTDVQSHAYGYFPPALKNRPWGERLEGWLEGLPFVPFPHAFQIFTGRRAR